MPHRATTADTRDRFAALLQAHRGIVVKVAAMYASEPADRADIAQDIAAHAWHAFPQFDDTRPFPTWLYRIALNAAISFARRDGPRRRDTVTIDAHLADTLADSAIDPDAELRRRTLERVMANLPDFDRALLLLYLDERSTRDIADILGISPSNVTTRIDRLKQRLRRTVDDASPGDTHATR